MHQSILCRFDPQIDGGDGPPTFSPSEILSDRHRADPKEGYFGWFSLLNVYAQTWESGFNCLEIGSNALQRSTTPRSFRKMVKERRKYPHFIQFRGFYLISRLFYTNQSKRKTLHLRLLPPIFRFAPTPDRMTGKFFQRSPFRSICPGGS